MTSIDRTAYPGFARVLSARALAEAFTPAGAEVGWARSCTDDEHHLLALVVWLKSYQRLGYFPKLAAVLFNQAVARARRRLPGETPAS